jgi:hypothetical protein
LGPGGRGEHEVGEQDGGGGEDEAMHAGDGTADLPRMGRRRAELLLSVAEL